MACIFLTSAPGGPLWVKAPLRDLVFEPETCRARGVGREALAEFSRKMMAGEVISGPEVCRR